MALKIDLTRCTACGLCMTVCSKRVFEADSDGRPTVAAEGNCSVCGHCVAVCPPGAIVHDQVDVPVLDDVGDQEVTPLGMKALLASKRSVRSYTDAPVDRDLLEQLIEAGRQAPTAKNLQDRGFIVITNRDTIRAMDKAVVEAYRKLLNLPARGILGLIVPALKQLNTVAPSLKRLCQRSDDGAFPIFHDAPVGIIGYGATGNSFSRDNCVIAQQYMMLQGQAMGLGSCSIGYASVRPKPLEAFVDVPAGNEIHTATIFGHPAVKFLRGVPRKAVDVDWLE